MQNLARPSLRVEQLLEDLAEGSSASDAAASADAILVAVGTSDAPWNITDDACDGPATGADLVPWDRYTEACIETHVERFRPTFDEVFARLAGLRAGQPTVLRAVELYNDWIGSEGGIPPEAARSRCAISMPGTR